MDEYLLFKAKNVIHKKKFDMKALFGDALLISNIHNGQSTAILCNIPGKLVSKWQLDGSANLPYWNALPDEIFFNTSWRKSKKNNYISFTNTQIGSTG